MPDCVENVIKLTMDSIGEGETTESQAKESEKRYTCKARSRNCGRGRDSKSLYPWVRFRATEVSYQ